MSDLSHDARELILVAQKEDGPTRSERERLRRAVFGAVAAGGTMLGSAGAAGAAGAKLTLLGGIAAKMSVAPLSIWFAVGTAAGIATVAPVAAYRYATRPSTEPAAIPVETAVASATPPPAQEPVAAVEHPVAPMHADVEPPPSGANAAAAPLDAKIERGAISGPLVEPHELAAELALLGAAQRELAAGRAERALERLAEHERVFPVGALLGERLAARVFALCALGRNAEARLATREFERVAPGSPLTPRVLASCGGSPDAKKLP